MGKINILPIFINNTFNFKIIIRLLKQKDFLLSIISDHA